MQEQTVVADHLYCLCNIDVSGVNNNNDIHGAIALRRTVMSLIAAKEKKRDILRGIM